MANALPGAKVVKTFNQLPAALLAREPNEGRGRRVMFVAGNHEDANSAVASLVSELGFAPIVLGRVDQGGRLLRYRGPLVLQNLIMLDAQAAAARLGQYLVTNPIINVEPLGSPWQTVDPFLLCAQHVDHYPAGFQSWPKQGRFAMYEASLESSEP